MEDTILVSRGIRCFEVDPQYVKEERSLFNGPGLGSGAKPPLGWKDARVFEYSIVDTDELCLDLRGNAYFQNGELRIYPNTNAKNGYIVATRECKQFKVVNPDTASVVLQIVESSFDEAWVQFNMGNPKYINEKNHLYYIGELELLTALLD